MFNFGGNSGNAITRLRSIRLLDHRHPCFILHATCRIIYLHSCCIGNRLGSMSERLSWDLPSRRSPISRLEDIDSHAASVAASHTRAGMNRGSSIKFLLIVRIIGGGRCKVYPRCSDLRFISGRYSIEIGLCRCPSPTAQRCRGSFRSFAIMVLLGGSRQSPKMRGLDFHRVRLSSLLLFICRSVFRGWRR